MTVCIKLAFSAAAYLTPSSQGIIASCVQLFFAWRVKVVTSNLWAVMLIVTCAVVNMRELSFLPTLALSLIFAGSRVHWNIHCSWNHTSLYRIRKIQSDCYYLVSATVESCIA